MHKIFEEQKKYYNTQVTKSYEFRRINLMKLAGALKRHEAELFDAFRIDLNKSKFEVYTTELALVYKEIDYLLKNLERLMEPKRLKNNYMMGTSTIMYSQPRGNVLIISPFNYPLLLSLMPLAGAIAAGDSAIVKLSELVPNVTKVIQKMLYMTFHSQYIYSCTGGVKVSDSLLNLPFDFIFFTGSPQVGKIVMEKASKHLTPVLLELGGKSPAIVLEDADIKETAKKIAWGKLVNAGQTCIAPDYVLIHQTKLDEFIELVIKNIEIMYGSNPQESPFYGRIVNEKHAKRLKGYIEKNKTKVIYGGKVEGTYVAPTLMVDTILEEEIFGPILPIRTFETLEEVYDVVEAYPHPLACYVFSTSDVDNIINRISFGSGMINNVIMQVASLDVPFGGVRGSGMGVYHGDETFKAFSHFKPMVKSYKWMIPVIRPPYDKWYQNIKLLRKFF